MASGVFDILHSGHLHYLWEARSYGDELVVVVATDSTVRRKKHEPITPERMRLELVSNLKPVDRAYLGKEGDMFAILEEARPDVIVLGYDQGEPEELEAALREKGHDIRVVKAAKFEDDLNGTRKIIQKVVDWYTARKMLDRVEGA